MKISQKKITLKEALRRRAQRRALKEAIAELHDKKSKSFVVEEDKTAKNKAAEFFTEADGDEEVIEIDDEGTPEDVQDIEVTDDEPVAEVDPIKDAIRTLAANAGMTADDFADLGAAPADDGDAEPEEEVTEAGDTEMMAAADFFNNPSKPEEESKKCDGCEEGKEKVCEDDTTPAEETPPSTDAEPVGDETTDLSVDTEIADLSGTTDLSADISATTDISGTVDNPATPEEEETAETAKKLADMTPEDWFQLLNQI